MTEPKLTKREREDLHIALTAAMAWEWEKNLPDSKARQMRYSALAAKFLRAWEKKSGRPKSEALRVGL